MSDTELQAIVPAGEEPIVVATPPPRVQLGPAGWLRANLFNSLPNAVLSVLFGALLAWAGYRTAKFVFVSAEWEIVRRNLRLFMIGRFPADELWRPWAALYLGTVALVVAVSSAARLARAEAAAAGAPHDDERPGLALARRLWPVAALLAVALGFTRSTGPALGVAGAIAVAVLVALGVRRLPVAVARWWWVASAGLVAAAVWTPSAADGVGWDDWGGLHLSVFVTVVGILAAFPLGVVVALARRSSLPALRYVAVGYVELFRGVPLVTLLIMSRFVLLFMFPTWYSPPGILTRAMMVIILFEGAYIAEVVRGGLQAVPRGQVEAAHALGLSAARTTRFVVLPQALRAVIPAMVGQFISLFKDTSLLSILGFFELVEVAGVVTQQPGFQAQGLDTITYAFIGFVFWVGCYTMSRESQRLERRLGVGLR